MASSVSLSSLLIVTTLIYLLHANHVTARRNRNGDGLVTLFKDFRAKQQLNIFLGDQFIVDVKLRSGRVDQYNDVSYLNITQYIDQSELPNEPTGNVTVIFERVENHLFNVTSVYPVNVVDGGNATTLTRTNNYPHKYVTDLTLRNSQNATLPSSKVLKISLSSHRIVTNTGIRICIAPNA